MFGIKIINKETRDVNQLLALEIDRQVIDEFKINALVELGANGLNTVPKGESSGISFAINQKFYTYLKSILDKSTLVDKDVILSGFKIAAKAKDELAMKIILETGFLKVSRKENNQQTLLMIVAKCGCLKAAKALLRKRANMNAQDEQGKSVLDYAMEGGYKPMIKLIKHVIKKEEERKEKLLVKRGTSFSG
ncbi:MAG: ankyrin repeat domain-containing protein [Candidatus Margulisiibacteriota bacterium]